MSFKIIQAVIEQVRIKPKSQYFRFNLALFLQGGRILIHGVDGLNRSAAVVIAYLMKSHPCLLEEAFFYVQVLRPFIRVLAFKPVSLRGNLT